MGNPSEAENRNPENSTNLPTIVGNEVFVNLTATITESRTESEISTIDSQQTFQINEESGNEAETVTENNVRNNNENVTDERTRTNTENRRHRLGTWPHQMSSLLACLCCTVGMYNINRFSILVYIYKVTFIFQYIILSFIFGIPFMYLQMALGQYMGTGIIDMWYISPAFKGLGVAFVFMLFFIGVYGAIPISWLFVYFKDSFVNTKDDYRWTKCQAAFTSMHCQYALNVSSPDYYGWSVASYFHGHVLDRKPNDYGFGQLKFEIAFDLCIVWLLVFLSLCRGSKSLGKVVLILGIMPSILLLLVTMRIIEQWGEGITEILPSSWKVSMTDSQSWLIAAREVFLTWGLFGAVALHLCSHNKFTAKLNKNVAILSIASISILLIASLLFASIMKIFPSNGITFLATSYEREDNVKVLQKFPTIKHPMLNVTVINYIVGNGLIYPKQSRFLSGYQIIRFATEVFPASLAVEGIQRISSFWSICFYAMMILFGLGQQVVLWSCVVESFISMKYKLLKPWQSTVTFIICNLAFLLGLPITSNIGIYIIFFMDFCMGALWWIIALYMSMMVAVLFVRGQKYGTDKIIVMLSQQTPIKGWILPILTFQWNVILPISFLVLFITFLRSSEFEAKFPWSEPVENYASWSLLIRRLAVWFQVTPLLLLCIYCVYQGFLHLVPKSDLTFSQKIQAWCCPVIEIEPPTETEPQTPSNSNAQGGIINSCYVDDPPPKYTPPPSYSTATARMMIKQLNPRKPSEIENTLHAANINLQRTLDG